MSSVARFCKIFFCGLVGGTLLDTYYYIYTDVELVLATSHNTTFKPYNLPYMGFAIWFGVGFITGSIISSILISDVGRRRQIFGGHRVPRVNRETIRLRNLGRGAVRAQPRRASLSIGDEGIYLSEQELSYQLEQQRIEKILATSVEDLSSVFMDDNSSEGAQPSIPSSPDVPVRGLKRTEVTVHPLRKSSSSEESPTQSLAYNLDMPSTSGLQRQSFRESSGPPSSRLRESTRRARDNLDSKEKSLKRKDSAKKN